jgi:hypothetical protein
MSRFPQTVIEKICTLHPTGRFIRTPQFQFSHNRYSKDFDLHIQVSLFKKYSCRRSESRSLASKFAEPQINKSANSERENLRTGHTPCAVSTKIAYRTVTVTRECLFTIRCYKWLYFSLCHAIHPYLSLRACCLVQSLLTNFL